MKTAEKALAENNGSAWNQAAELEVIYRRAPVGLAGYDRNLRFIRINDALARFHQLSPEEHIGRRVDEVSSRFGNQIAKYVHASLCIGRIHPERGEAQSRTGESGERAR